jgi:hypothetical protein
MAVADQSTLSLTLSSPLPSASALSDSTDEDEHSPQRQRQRHEFTLHSASSPTSHVSVSLRSPNSHGISSHSLSLSQVLSSSSLVKPKPRPGPAVSWKLHDGDDDESNLSLSASVSASMDDHNSTRDRPSVRRSLDSDRHKYSTHDRDLSGRTALEDDEEEEEDSEIPRMHETDSRLSLSHVSSSRNDETRDRDDTGSTSLDSLERSPSPPRATSLPARPSFERWSGAAAADRSPDDVNGSDSDSDGSASSDSSSQTPPLRSRYASTLRSSLHTATIHRVGLQPTARSDARQATATAARLELERDTAALRARMARLSAPMRGAPSLPSRRSQLDDDDDDDASPPRSTFSSARVHAPLRAQQLPMAAPPRLPAIASSHRIAALAPPSLRLLSSAPHSLMRQAADSLRAARMTSTARAH